MTTRNSMIKKTALSTVIALSALGAGTASSQAMQIYNCTNDSLPVVVTHVDSGRSYGSISLKPNQSANWNTGRGTGFRVSINVIGPDKHFSGRKGGEIISIKNLAGNTELVTGNQCSQPVRGSDNSQGTNGNDVAAIIAGTILGLILNEVSK